MIRVHVRDRNGVDCVRCSGVDENQFFAGIDEPFVDRGRDAHRRQECGLKQFFCARLVSTEQCGLKREIAVAEHRDLERANLMTVDARSLHACKWRSHTTLRLLFEANIRLGLWAR